MPPVKILTAAQLKGSTWAERYPHKADELYVVLTAGKRRTVKRIGPPTPENRAEAERKARAYSAVLERQEFAAKGIIGPLWDTAVRDYLRRGMGDYAKRTREARKTQLDAIGAIVGDGTTLDRIDAETVLQLYAILRETRTHRTAVSHLDALSRLFQWHEIDNPVPAARQRIQAAQPRTASTRAIDEGNCRPVPTESMAKVWPRLSGDVLTVSLLCHDLGLRIGEALGLEWPDITWGTDENDAGRRVRIERSRRGRDLGKTKSGRGRAVSMSRRVRSHLRAIWMERGRPSSGRVVGFTDPKALAKRLGDACAAAKVDRIRFKDLRDTYASTLITHGIVLKWISLQLGHGSVAVTERHYARYMAVEGYQNPWIVPDGAVPGDLLAELESAKAGRSGENPDRTLADRRGGALGSGRSSQHGP